MISELEIWARESVSDPKTGVEQVRDIFPSESEKGWLNLGTISTQQLNGLFRSLTQYAQASPYSPHLHLDSKDIPETSLEWIDGGAIDQSEAPELYEYYGGTFPTLGNPLAGWKFIVRKL